MVGPAVGSHWVLDGLVHGPELPLAGRGSSRVGLGLWDTMPLGLAVDLVVAGLAAWLGRGPRP